MTPPTSARVAVLVLLALAAAVVWWARLDLGAMPEVTRFRDDAYYEFAWARSLAAGHGPCVVPGVPTTGVQLLWSTALAGVASGFGVAALPVAAHVLGLSLHLVAAALVGWVLCAAGSRVWCAVAAALLFAGNPFHPGFNNAQRGLTVANFLTLIVCGRH